MSNKRKDYLTEVFSDENVMYMEIVTYIQKDGVTKRKTMKVSACSCKTHNHHITEVSYLPLPQIYGERYKDE